jgi:ATP-binding cassette, subfamily B, bacterial PglK
MNLRIFKYFKSFINTIKSFGLLLDSKDNKKALIMLVLIIIGTFLEMLSLGLIFPAIQLVLNENFIYEYSFLNNIKNNFSLTENSLIIFILLFLVLIFLIKNIFLILIIVFRAKFTESLRKKISKKLYSRYLSQNFNFFVNRNSSELIRNLHQEVPKIIQGIDGILIFFTEVLILIGMGIILLYLSPYATTIIIISTLVIFFIYILLTRKRIFELGKNDQIFYSDLLKESQQGFGNFKEVYIYQLKDTFIFQFLKILTKYSKNNRILYIFQQLPRILFEQIGIILIVAVSILIFFEETDKAKALGIIGVYAYAFFRLLPSINKLIVNIQLIIFVKPSANMINDELNINYHEEQKTNSFELIKFKKKINLVNIDYKPIFENKKILKNINLIIEKNSKIGIIGETGSGKSTLLNLIMGLIEPSIGHIEVDEKILKHSSIDWRNKISFVSQSTYLFDDTILNNITFSHDDNSIDKKKLNKAIEIACLDDFIDKLDYKLKTIVGERGSKISGGELQRICIARAMYNESEILVLDECTSALDEKTEKKIIENLFKLNKTIIIASHKASTLKYCDKIFKVSNFSLEKIK